ncbi:MAG: hypothetical protein ABI655_06865 [Phenylobacterium sp.]
MARLRLALSAALSASAALALLAACDNGPSAVAGKQATATQLPAAPEAAEAPKADHRAEPAKVVDGQPMWSASRKYSAEEGARRTFERNGADFGARDVDQFVRKAHAFVENPPKGTLTLSRPNGDTLFYDPKANVFAVASKEGAPKTMFKPDAGMAYWEQQKQAQTKRTRAKRSDDEA